MAQRLGCLVVYAPVSVRAEPSPIIKAGGAVSNMETTISSNNAGAETSNYKVGASLWNGIMGVGNWLASGNGPAQCRQGRAVPLLGIS